MATPVDIANLALAHLGENATVASLEPPEGSAQAVHLARFYPIARDNMQESYPWNFCTRRIAPPMLTSETTAYQYAYQIPNNALNIFSVLPPEANNDYVEHFDDSIVSLANVVAGVSHQQGVNVPKNYARETLEDGQQVIYTDVQNAIVRYSVREEDSAKFSPLFVAALGRLLASYCAGPIIKGRFGRKEAEFQFSMFRAEVGVAQAADANQTKHYINHTPSWIANR